MKLNYSTKYKDRDPQSTIDILKQFFINKGFDLKLTSNLHSEADTWSCRWEIYYKNRFILGQNGKGVSEQYSFASGLAELYERFCNIPILWSFNPFWFNQYNKIIGFSDSINLSFDDNINSYFPIYYYLTSWLGIYKYKDFYNEVISQGIGVPYTDILDNSVKYFDPRLIVRTNGSFGMCAGNSKEEALIQGISELYEILCTIYLYQSNSKVIFNRIDDSLITNPTILHMKNKIEMATKGQVFFLDFSTQFKLPVVAACYVNTNPNTLIINFGASPYFDIALERSLTEIYQGRSIQNEAIVLKPMEAAKTFDYWAAYPGAVGRSGFIPTGFFDNYYTIKELPQGVFLTEEKSQIETLEHLKQLGLRQNYHFYIKDMSLCEDMKAYHIIPSFSIAAPVTSSYTLSEEDRDNILTNIKQDKIFLNTILTTPNINIDSHMIQYLSALKEQQPNYLLQCFGWHSLYGTTDDLITLILSLYYSNKNYYYSNFCSLLDALKGKFLYSYINDWLSNTNSQDFLSHGITYSKEPNLLNLLYFEYNQFLPDFITTLKMEEE